jgi:hypothetical protein
MPSVAIAASGLIAKRRLSSVMLTGDALAVLICLDDGSPVVRQLFRHSGRIWSFPKRAPNALCCSTEVLRRCLIDFVQLTVAHGLREIDTKNLNVGDGVILRGSIITQVI